MMMDYEWGNPASAAAAMLLFGEESGADTGQEQRAVFDHYGVQGLNTIGISDYFPQPPQPLTAAALFSPSSSSSSSCHPRYGLALPPAPTRIGLNLGVRTYFSSASPEDELQAAAAGNPPPRACRRRTRTARCQAEGCGADLTHAKHYHRRHKVCEFHSKASIVITAGLSQRFCQQCSRFHVLAEFDQGKRSCRKRLADHNRRRRKSQDLSTAPIISQANNSAPPNVANTNSSGSSGITTTSHSPAKPETALFNNNNNNSSTNNNDDINNDGSNNNNNNNNNEDDGDDGDDGQINNRNSAFSAFLGCNPEGDSSASHVSSTLVPAAAQVALGLGRSSGIVATVANAIMGLSATSSTGTTSPPSVSFLPHLGEQRFSSWVAPTAVAEDESCIRGIYQSK